MARAVADDGFKYFFGFSVEVADGEVEGAACVWEEGHLPQRGLFLFEAERDGDAAISLLAANSFDFANAKPSC